MLRKTLMFLMGVFFIFGAITFSFAQGAQTESGPESQIKAVDVGNKVCPVSGEKIDEKTKATYEYQGKIYNFCCSKCIEDFKKDPEKYIKKMEEELKPQDKQEDKEINQVMPEKEEGHQHHHH